MSEINKSDKTKTKRIFIIICALVFLLSLILNCFTPYLADDFYFSLRFDNGERLHSLSDLFKSLAYHYKEWSGRVIVKFFAQGFTMLPKIVFNAFNAAAYLALGLVIYRLAFGRKKEYRISAFLLIEASLWEINPAWGQTNLWMCGACNYLWATLGCFVYLLPWRFHLEKPLKPYKWLPAAMLLGGIAAGWLSENGSAGMIVCLALCILAEWKQRKKIPLWMVSGFIGTLVGFAILILAPGNYNRSDATGEYTSFLTKYAVRFFNCLNMLKDYGLPLLFAFAVLYTLLWFQKSGKNENNALSIPMILLLGGLSANFAMMASAVYYDRSSHSVFAFLTAACAACMAQLDGAVMRRSFAAITACVGVLCGFHLLEAGYDIASYYMMYRTRDVLIRQELSETEKPGWATVTTYAIEPYTKWCGAYGLPDIREEGEDSLALGRAMWYGAGRIVADEVRTYPFPGHSNDAWNDESETT